MARNTLKNPYSDFKDKLRGTSTAQPTRTVVTDTSPGRKPKNASKYAKTIMKQADQKESRRSMKTANKGVTEIAGKAKGEEKNTRKYTYGVTQSGRPNPKYTYRKALKK